jgi:hypothetical protein
MQEFLAFGQDGEFLWKATSNLGYNYSTVTVPGNATGNSLPNFYKFS